MKRSACIAHIRQLCCLGLGGEAIMPALLRDLHDLVPCDSAGFFWVDERCEMSNLCAEKMLAPDLMRLYFSRFYNKGEQSFHTGFGERVKTAPPVEATHFSDDFYRGEYYNLIWRHLDVHHALYAVIREGGRSLGQLSLYRTRKDPVFTSVERDLLGSVVRYIAHGLSVAPARAEVWKGLMQDAEQASGLIILDRNGKLMQMSPQGRRLLFLAAYSRISPATLGTGMDDVPPELVNLCTNLCRVFVGESALPPVLHTQNAWGKFVFRAYWMSDNPNADDALIGVTVQHQEVFPLTLMRAMKTAALSAKQKEVVLLLARGRSHQEIAREMNVSLNTANYHVKQVYDRLDAHDRGEVMQKLLTSHA